MGNKTDAKQIGMIAFAVIAVIIAAVVIFKTVRAGQPVITQTINLPTGGSPKAQFMKKQAQKGGGISPMSLGDKQ